MLSRVIKLLHIFSLFILMNNAFAISDLGKRIKKIEREVNCHDYGRVECVRSKLESMYLIDQYLHKSIDFNSNENIRLMERYNKENADTLKSMLEKYFWITITQFGVEADKQAWIIAQHADHDLPFQHQVLFILEKMKDKKETDVKNYAYLYDRVALNYRNFGIKQRFGTQAALVEGKYVILPYEGSETELNKRRSIIGLNSINEYAKDLNDIMKSASK